MPKGYKDLLADADAVVRSVEAADMAAIPDGVVMVDIRDPRELEREGMIPGAFHAPRGMLEFWIDPESPYHKPKFAEPRTFVFYARPAGARCSPPRSRRRWDLTRAACAAASRSGRSAAISSPRDRGQLGSTTGTIAFAAP